MSSGANIVEQPLIVVPGAPSIDIDCQGLWSFKALKTSDTEMGGNSQKSLVNRPSW